MTNQQVSRYLTLLDRRSIIMANNVTDWRPEYSTELQSIEKELSVLRVAAGQENGRAQAGDNEVVPTMVTITEAAKRTGLSYDCLRKMVLRGQIAHVNAGRKTLINLERLIEYLDRGQEVNA